MNTINRSHTLPTLGALIEHARMADTDRLCMVRRPAEGRAATLYIVLVGPRAVRDLGPFLIEHFKRLPRQGSIIERALIVEPSTPFVQIQHWMDQNGLFYAWQELAINGHTGLFTAVTGPSVTPNFCSQLTALGLMCRLD